MEVENDCFSLFILQGKTMLRYSVSIAHNMRGILINVRKIWLTRLIPVTPDGGTYVFVIYGNTNELKCSSFRILIF